ncbi:MAG: alpha/beta hydrolase [Acutalibacteraceae bacterium]
MKKVISLVLSLVFVFSLSAFVFAENGEEEKGARLSMGYIHFEDQRSTFQINLDKFKNIVGIVFKAMTGCIGTGGKYVNSDRSYAHISSSSSFRHCMNHPALEGFGEYVLPWEDGAVKTLVPPLSLDFMCRCLGYDSETVADGINFLIDMKNEENLKVLDYYKQEEKQADESKNSTKLIFVPGDPGAPFAVVIAGGGFNSVCMIQEAFPIAMKLHKKGYNVFMLKYRVGEHENDADEFEKRYRAYEDTDRAMKYIFDNAAKLNILTENYSVLGFSAGARITLTYATDSKYGYAANELPQPGMIAPIYVEPWEDIECNETVPAVFMGMGTNDEYYGENGCEACKMLCDKLNSAGVDSVYEEYENMKHGFGLGVGTIAEGWLDRAVELWEKQF